MNGIELLAARFAQVKQRGEKALIAYITAGDPSLETTAKLVASLDQAGADIIEMGVPFSDPVADGPVIQRAVNRALANGTTLAGILDLAANLTNKVATPLVLMSYYNPILQYGLDQFCHDAARAGVAGIIVPDLPLEEAGPILAASELAGLAWIPLVAPTTDGQRLARIAAAGSGFVYCVTVTGITGTTQDVTGEIGRIAKEVRSLTELPVAAGFGIGTPEQAAAVARYCDAVVVGSAFVKLVEKQGKDSMKVVSELASQLKQALKG
ncbi:Tryptophan synthase alpha chain [Desulfotomaculum nigrificans CO-1-SRB]|uniref:Tryptophan synthase alpha chain n=1 Tax=Desulfotomaculum nigrificans (strain DSM 14880 / VKM B-2319 / CO-1-SRB) TaxID=868595 RepID=F6B7H9_DESCC|nr:tryptophan synthase subunit alpha [Desulfotomaculum nigrificans]AEF94533.1 Tryptophan synthase alpha chain [Desulfotomaculum nigrificans CO-1-SRB]